MTGRRGKNLLLLVSVVLAGLIFACTTQVWYSFDVGLPEHVTVSGTVAAPALSALALADLVLVLALAIAGRFFRVVLAVIQALVGVAVVASVATSIADPFTASAPAIAKATGVTGKTYSIGDAHDAGQTAWPVLALVVGILLIVAAVAILVLARTWPNSTSRKYTRMAPASAERTSVDDWDSLSGGEDPTTENNPN